MGNLIDDSIVRLSFDNRQFEQGIQQSMDSVTELNTVVNREMSRVSESFNPLINGINVLQRSMSTGGVIISSIFNRLTNDLISSVNRMVNNAIIPMRKMMTSLTTVPMKTGLQEYELKMKSVQVMMASTGESIDKINGYLDELNKYSDRTIYSFADMTSNIGKFTNAGVKLDVAVEAMRGLMNEAALAGATTAEASRAMYNLAQSLSMGYVQYIDWKSIENANMATIDFKKNLANTAVELGILKKVGEGVYSTGKKSYTLQQLFKDGLKSQWLSTEALTTTLRKYQDESEGASEETRKLAKRAYAAAQDMKTFSQMVDTIKEALQSGWSMTWQNLFGNLVEAKQLWTAIGVSLNDFIGKIDDYRNHILSIANIHGFRDNLITIVLETLDDASKIFYQFKMAFDDVFGNIFKETTSMGFLIRNLVRLSEVLKDIHNKLKLNDQSIKALRISFRAFFSVCELVWRAFDETGRALSQLLAGTDNLSVGLGRIATLMSVVVLATVDWIKESGKITNTINFIKEKAVELATGIFSVFSSLGKVFNTENFYKLFDQLKKFFINIKNWVTGFDIGEIDFSGFLDSFDGLMDRLGNVEINLDGFAEFLISIGTVVIQTCRMILTPLASMGQVILRFSNAIISIFERMSSRQFIRLVRIIVTALTKLISLYMKLSIKNKNPGKLDVIFDNIGSLMQGVGNLFFGVGSVLNRFAFVELAGKIAEIVASIAMVVKGIADIIINIAWLIGIATASAFVIKQFGLLPQLIVIMGMVAGLCLSISAVFASISANNLKPEEITPFIKAMEMIIFQILSLGASAALLSVVENSIPKLLSLTACVAVLTFVAGYIARELNNTTLRSGQTANKQKIKIMASMVALISGMGLVLAAITKIVNSDYNMSKLYLLEGAMTVMSGMILGLQIIINELDKSGYINSSWSKFGPLLGQISSLFAELIISIGFLSAISNRLKSISSLWNVIGATEILTITAVALYSTLSTLIPMDWAKAGSIIGQIAALLAEAIIGLLVITGISNEVKDIDKFWTAVLGLITMMGGLELLVFGVILLGKAISGADFVSVLGALGTLGAVVLEISLLGEAIGRISNLVKDPSKFITIAASISAMFTVLEVLTLGVIGIGALITAFPEIAGIGALVGVLSLAIFVQLIVAVVAEIELLRESMPDQNALMSFLSSIGKFMLELAGSMLAGIAAGIAALAFIPYLIPLALIPVGLGLVFEPISNMYEKYSKKINGMTMFLISLPPFFSIFSEIMTSLTDISTMAKTSLIGVASLIPMVLMIGLIFKELLILGKLFSSNAMKKVTEMSISLGNSIKPLVRVFTLLSDFSSTGRASLKGMVMFLALMPIIGVISDVMGKVSKKLQYNKNEIMDTFTVLSDIFRKINNDIYYGMIKTINILRQLSRVDFENLIKTTLGVFVVNLFHNIGRLPWKEQKSMMDDLVDFGKGLAAFAESISGITNFDNVGSAIKQIADIASASNRINNTEGTLLGKLFGDNSIGRLGNGLGEFARNIKELDEELTGVNLDKNGSVDKVVDYIKRLSRSRITNTSGSLRSLFFGNNSLEKFGKELESFGTSFKQFALSVTSYKKTTTSITENGSLSDPSSVLATQSEEMLYDFETIDKVIQRISDLKFATAGIWNVGGILSLFVGNNSLAKFGKELASFGESFALFSENIKGIDWNSVDKFDTEKVNELIDWASEAVGKFDDIIEKLIVDSLALITNSIVLLVTTIKEALSPGLFNGIIRLIIVLGSSISLVIETAKDPLNDFFNFLSVIIPSIIGFLSNTIGNTTWLNAVANCIDKICKSIKELTTDAIIPLLQNGITPLVDTILKANPIYLLTKIIELSNLVVKSILIGTVLIATGVMSLAEFIDNTVKTWLERGINKILMFFVMIGFHIELFKQTVKDIVDDIWKDIEKQLDEIDSEKIISKIEDFAKQAALAIVDNFLAEVTNGVSTLYEEIYKLYDLYMKVSENANSSAGPSGGSGGGPSSGYNGPAHTQPGKSSSYDPWVPDDLVPSDETIDEAAQETKDKFIGSFENSPASTHAKKDEEVRDKLERHYSTGFDSSPAATHGKKNTDYNYWRSEMYANQNKASTRKMNDWVNDDLYKWTKEKIDNAKFLSDESKATLTKYLNEYYPKVADGLGMVDSVKDFYTGFVDSLADAGKAYEDAQNVFNQNDQAADEKTKATTEKRLLSESAYWAQLLELKKQGVDGAKYQDMALADFEEEILNHVNEVYDNYINTYQSKVSQFENLGSIFNKVDFGFDPDNPFTKEDLFGNLQDQITQLDRYADVMASLNDRIDTAELRDTINNMGVDSLEELEALNSLTEAELDNYEAMFVSKMESAARTADVVTRDLYENSMAEIANTIGMPDLPADEIFEWFNGTLTSFDNMMASKGLEFGKIGNDVVEGLTTGMTDETSKAMTDEAGETVAEDIEEGLCDDGALDVNSPSKRMIPVGEYVIEGLSDGMTNSASVSRIKATVALVAAWYKSEFADKMDDFEECGRNLMLGLERGINSGIYAATYATGVSADSIYNVYPRKFGIHSPSTVFEAFGNYLMEGLSLGVKNGTSNAEKTMEQSANSTLGIMQSAVERAYAAMNSESVPAITPVVNMNKLQNGLRTMDTALAAQRSYLMANAANASIDTSVHKEVSINNQAAVDAITRLNGDILNLGDRLANMQIMLDTGIVAGQMAPAMNSELGTLMSRSIREGVG